MNDEDSFLDMTNDENEEDHESTNESMDSSLFKDGSSIDNVSEDEEFNFKEESLIARIDDLENEIREDIFESKELFRETTDNTEQYSSDDDNDDQSNSCKEILQDIIHERPKRSNAGRGVERLEPDFNKKSYGTAKHILLLMKEENKVDNQSFSSNKCFMSRAVNVFFTQMSATKGIRKHGERPLRCC